MDPQHSSNPTPELIKIKTIFLRVMFKLFLISSQLAVKPIPVADHSLGEGPFPDI